MDTIDPDLLPREVAITAITLAELAAGPHATDDHNERARRHDRLQRTEAAFDPLLSTQKRPGRTVASMPQRLVLVAMLEVREQSTY